MGPCGPASAQRGLAHRALALGWAIGQRPPAPRRARPGWGFLFGKYLYRSNMYPLRIRPPDKPGLNLPDNRFGPWGPAG